MKRDCACPRVATPHRHGTWHAYTSCLCRCQPCRDAWATYCRRARARAYLAGGQLLVDPTGTARRLQALAAVGYSSREIARHLGINDTPVRELQHGKHTKISHRTRDRITALYEQLWDQPPAGRYGRMIRNYAAGNGWAPPLAWDDDTIDDPYYRPARPAAVSSTDSDVDEVAVSEAIAGRRVALTRAERAEAVRIMTARGHSAREIGERLGETGRTVVRRRAAA